MDLKALLVEAKQKVPPVLQVLQTGDETMLDIGGKLSHLNSYSLIMFLVSFWILTASCDMTEASCILYNPFLTSDSSFFLQAREDVHSVVVLVIVLQTVPSWRPCRPSRSPTLEGKTTWLIAQWTSKSLSLGARFSSAEQNLKAFLRKLYSNVSHHRRKEVDIITLPTL